LQGLIYELLSSRGRQGLNYVFVCPKFSTPSSQASFSFGGKAISPFLFLPPDLALGWDVIGGLLRLAFSSNDEDGMRRELKQKAFRKTEGMKSISLPIGKD